MDNRPDKERRLDRAFGGKGAYRQFVLDRRDAGATVREIVTYTKAYEPISNNTLWLWIRRWQEEANDALLNQSA